MALKHLTPILWTKDLEATISFYTNVLGFRSERNFPNFVSFSSGDVQIMYIVPTDDREDGEDLNNNEEFFPKPLLTGSIYIFTEDVDDIWELVKDKAVIKSAICDRQYLMRDFSILDNNGYELCFGQDISGDR